MNDSWFSNDFEAYTFINQVDNLETTAIANWAEVCTIKNSRSKLLIFSKNNFTDFLIDDR